MEASAIQRFWSYVSANNESTGLLCQCLDTDLCCQRLRAIISVVGLLLTPICIVSVNGQCYVLATSPGSDLCCLCCLHMSLQWEAINLLRFLIVSKSFLSCQWQQYPLLISVAKIYFAAWSMGVFVDELWVYLCMKYGRICAWTIGVFVHEVLAHLCMNYGCICAWSMGVFVDTKMDI